MGGGGNSEFAYKMLIFAMVIMVSLPMMITVFIPTMEQQNADSVLEDYYDFTGASRSQTKEAVWVLRGIYTPYEGDKYNYTEDGWLYGARVSGYAPSQYQGTQFGFEVYLSEDGYYRYLYDSADYDPDKGTGHKGMFQNKDAEEAQGSGDIYTSVVFDSNEKSDIFFTKDSKYNSDGSPYNKDIDVPFYYSFSGWRYSFSPLSDSTTLDADGNPIKIIATSSSLSLIWYYYYTAYGGIAGQLVLSGSDEGVSYLSGDQIVRAFDSTTSTARFNMTFNGGVQMGIYIRIDPYYLTQGYTVKDCYDAGLWSIMVTSLSTDSDAYTGTDYSLNIWSIFETLIDLMTFNYADYGMSTFMGIICSMIVVIPLYAGLISLAIDSYPVLILTGILAVFQTIASVLGNLNFLSGLFG